MMEDERFDENMEQTDYSDKSIPAGRGLAEEERN